VLARRLAEPAVVVVRDGAAGCLLTRDGHTEYVRGFPVAAIDTTGAGDAHCRVFPAELLRGADQHTAAVRADAAAALAVTRRGPATAPAVRRSTRCWHLRVPDACARQGGSAGGTGGQRQVIAHDRALPPGVAAADTDDRT
jgi:fructose-1-phosphate kinase PfkB-like protein